MRRTPIVLTVAMLAGCTTSAADAPAAAPEPPRPAVTGAPEVELPPSAIRTVATGLRIPWGLAFLPDGTALVTERGNAVPTGIRPTTPGTREVIDTSGVPRILSVTPAGKVTEVQRLSEVDTRIGEGGLLGLAVSPTYATDRWVYIYYSAATDNRIARLHLGEPPQPILTDIPVADLEGARYHQGGRLAFGPDGMLYASVGETFVTRDIAQDRANLGGKILRLTPEGRPAPGNPFPDSPVWSYGHRNVQGMAWDAAGRMYASEFGAGLFDELNVIRPGANYGWPVVEGASSDPRFVNPIASWTPTRIASPSGTAVLGDHVYLACLAGRQLYRVSLDGRTVEALLVGDYGRLRTIEKAPDGSLWIMTSNRDGRGTPAADDDRILRITP
jgi:glucose/arabinose dehydrogenase